MYQKSHRVMYVIALTVHCSHYNWFVGHDAKNAHLLQEINKNITVQKVDTSNMVGILISMHVTYQI